MWSDLAGSIDHDINRRRLTRLIDIYLDGMPPWLQRQPHALLTQRISDPQSAAWDLQKPAEGFPASDFPVNTPDPDDGVALLTMHDADDKCAITRRDLLVL